MRNAILWTVVLIGITSFANCDDGSTDDPPTCSDGLQNQSEVGIDCGGPCPNVCEPSCNDGVHNQDEEGVDCGGYCPQDCLESCNDGVQNQDEEGIDCGGACPNSCEPSCSDGVQNQDEEGIDCGGTCPTACEPSCDDGVHNQDEEGVDCGGSCPAPCSTSCDDGEQNDGEEGIDCGGSCPNGCEFLIRDEIHTFTDEDCGWYFWYDTSRIPADWYEPANFWNGRIYTRYEVLDQPTTTASGFQFVMWERLGDELAGSPFGFDSSGDTFNGVGSVGEFNEVMNTYWIEGAGIDLTDTANIWRLGIAVHEFPNGWISCPSWGYSEERWDRRGNWFPMQLRFTIVAVAEGADFSGWDAWVATDPTDGTSIGPNPEGG